MLLIELDRIEMQLYGDGVLQGIRLILLESNQLHAYPFEVVQVFLAEFFQEDFCIRFYQAIVTADPAVVMTVHIVEEQIVVAVVDEIGFITTLLHDLCRFERKIRQVDIHPFPLGCFFNFHFLLFRLRFRGRLLHLRLRLYFRTVRTMHLHLILSDNHNAFTNQRRNVESVFIFHQYLVFSFKTTHDTASRCIQEADFITYLYITHSFCRLYFVSTKILHYTIISYKFVLLHPGSTRMCLINRDSNGYKNSTDKY